MPTTSKEPDKQDQQLSLGQHIDILRQGLIRVVIVLAILYIIVVALLPYIFDTLILAPTHHLDIQIININVAAQFTTHLTTALYLTLIIAAPYLLYELWRYLKPALYTHEKHLINRLFLLATLLFYIGIAIGYLLIFPLTFRFLATYNIGKEIVNTFNLQSYIALLTNLLLTMGIVCELPLLLYALSAIGILDRQTLKHYRRHAIVALLIAAALITPTGDPGTLLVVFLPLYALYELSLLICRKRR